MQLLFIYLFFNNSLLTPDFLFLKYHKLDRLAQWSGCGTHRMWDPSVVCFNESGAGRQSPPLTG